MRKVALVILAVISLSLLVPVKSFAINPDKAQGQTQDEDNCVKTAIIGNGKVCDDGNGSSVIDALRLVVNIMSVGVGILGVVGITIVGIQYLTAGGNEEKTRTAKRRILEIVIGLAVYAVAYAILYWLLPGFSGI
ncbi:hypothetical protein IKG10_00495 [Candidatus Saccharibacteria bacterium]|nr:hypothetical protein [Candidatus Saccharibacteria bacterium]